MLTIMERNGIMTQKTETKGRFHSQSEDEEEIDEEEETEESERDTE